MAAITKRPPTIWKGERLFVYGALLDPNERLRLLGREVPAEAARLIGYRRGRARFFFVVPSPGETVEGRILSDFDGDDFAILDRYEEVPTLYTRERISVLDSSDDPIECWIYKPTGWERG